MAVKLMGRSCDCFLHCWGHVNVDNRQNSSVGFTVLAATIYRMLTWLVASKFCQLSATTVVAISAGIRAAIMSTLVVSLCVYVSYGHVDRALRGQKLNGGTPKTDQRGKHTNRPNRTLEDIQAVKTHIETLPRYINHYSSKDNPDREYLFQSLGCMTFVSKCREEGCSPVKFTTIFFVVLSTTSHLEVLNTIHGKFPMG